MTITLPAVVVWIPVGTAKSESSSQTIHFGKKNSVHVMV